MPYQVPRAGAHAASVASLLPLTVAGALCFHLGAGLVTCLLAGLMALMLSNFARFVLLQATAFEVWHAGSLLFSGLERLRAASGFDVDPILAELERRGVEVVRPSKAQASCTGGG